MKVLKKIGKFLLYFLGIVILLLLIASIAIDPIAKNVIERQVNKADDRQYKLKLEDVDISLLSGNIILEGILLQTDTSKAREEDVPVVYLAAGEISAEGISWFDFLLTNELFIDRISLLNIETEMRVRTMGDDEETKPFRWDQLDIYPDIKKYIDRIRLKDLRFNQIDLTLINMESADTLLFSSSEFNLNSDDILIDADKVINDARAFYASQIDLEGKDIDIRRAGNVNWDMDFDLVYIDTREEDLSLLSENMVFLNKNNTVNDTLIFARYNKFELNDIELNALRKDSVANIRSLILHNLNVFTNLDAEKKLESEASEKPEPRNSQSIDLSVFSLGESLPGFVHQISIEEIDLQDISFNQNNELVVERFSLESHNFRLDSAPAFSGNRFLHSGHFQSSVHGMKINDVASYLVNLNSVHVDIENGKGNIQLNDLSVKPLQNQSVKTSIHLNLPELLVSRLNVTELTSKVLKIDSIAINKPTIQMSMAGSQKESGDIGSLYPFISDFLTSLSIRKAALISGDIEVEGFGEQQQDIRLPVVYVQVSDMNVAEGNAFAGRRIFHADDIAVRLENIGYTFPDNFYEAKLELVRMSTREKFLNLSNFSYSYTDNYKQLLEAPESNQVYSIKGNHFFISNLEFQDIIKGNGFFASGVLLEGLEIDVFKDNNYPREESDSKVYPTPQAMIMAIGMPFYIGEFNLNEGSFTFKEMAEGGEEPGVFTADELNVRLKNLSNNRNILDNIPETSLDASTKLMGTGLLEIQVKIPLPDKNQPVLVSGSLDTLKLVKLNEYMEYTTRFGIESGTFYKVRWDFQTNNGVAQGKFGMSYENLNIQLSEAESPDTDGFVNTVGTYLANVLVLDEDMAEGRNEKLETVTFKREKEEEEGFIEHYLNSLVTGFVEVMGFPLSIIDP